MPAYKRRTNKRYTSLKYKQAFKRKKSINSFFKLVGISVTGLVLFSVAFYLYTLTLILKEPFVKASGFVDFSKNSYDSNNDFSVMLVELDDIKDTASKVNKLYLYKISPKNARSIIIEIPVNAVSAGFYTDATLVSDLYFLGNSNDESRGVTNLKKLILKNFAVSVDSYILYDGDTLKQLSDLNININRNDIPNSIRYTSFLNVSKIFEILRKHIKSDLSSVEFFKIVTDTKNLSQSEFKFISILSSDFTDTNKFDNLWLNYNNLELNLNYRNTVIVLNSTETPGLALWGSRIVKNIGASVIDVGNQTETENETVIYTNNFDLPLVSYLSNILKIKKIKHTKDYIKDPFLASRADVLIIMGKDTASMFK